jgi:hypothetical protein
VTGTPDTFEPPLRKPSARVSIVIFVLSVTLMWWLRLHIFRDQFITLSYGLPLLLCLWHRDRLLLWIMTLAFLALSAVKAFLLLERVDPVMDSAQWLMQVINTVVIAGTVHFVLVLFERLDVRNRELQRTNEELAAREEEINRQNEELQVQSEELAQQNEELQQQSEELQNQSAELHSQAEELQGTNEELKQRESILQRLLESLRITESDSAVLESLCRSALDLIGDAAQAAAIV